MGTVYLIGDYEKEGCYKIGVTKGKIENRINSLQTGNSGEIYLIKHYETEHPFFTEARLHQRFKSCNIINEWFELPKDDVDKFIDYCVEIDKIVDSLKDNPFFPKNLK